MRLNWISGLAIGSLVFLGSCMDTEDPNAQLNAEVKAIDAYLAANPTSDYVLKDEYSGIRFVIHNFGEGRFPVQGKTVKYTYEAKIMGSNVPFDLGNYSGKIEDITVPGLRYSIGNLLEGTSATVYIPSEYAFGETGSGPVPGNTTVVYTFYFSEVVRTTTEVTQWKLDTAAIHAHFEANSITTAEELESGISYVIHQQGTGGYPVLFDRVSFDYKMMLLSGTVIDERSLSNFSLYQLIDALKIGIPKVKEGTKVTFYIPSLYGYGATANGNIPANSVLKFEMTLTGIDTN